MSIKPMVCPKCHLYWGELDIKDYPDISAKHLKAVAGGGSRKKFKNGQSIRCSDCGYEYTSWDVILVCAGPEVKDLKPGQRQEF